MITVVPAKKVEFRERVERHVLDFALNEGLSWTAVRDSKEIEEAIVNIANTFWWIKNNVRQSTFDKINMGLLKKKKEGIIKNDSGR
jgi:hypothetical protein